MSASPYIFDQRGYVIRQAADILDDYSGDDAPAEPIVLELNDGQPEARLYLSIAQARSLADRLNQAATDTERAAAPLRPDGRPWKLALCRCRRPGHQDPADCPRYAGR